MRVSVFLNAKESKMKLNEYEIVVNSLCTDQRNVFTSLGIPKISTNVKKVVI